MSLSKRCILKLLQMRNLHSVSEVTNNFVTTIASKRTLSTCLYRGVCCGKYTESSSSGKILQRVMKIVEVNTPIVMQRREKNESSSAEKGYYKTSKRRSSRMQLYYTLKHYIQSPENADNFVAHLKEKERHLLLDALNSTIGTEKIENAEESSEITRQQLLYVFLHNCIPFVGFGFLDNAIMIMAGEYIDVTIGVAFGITTMAAAALGNAISDLAGIGLAGYVEMLFLRMGLPVPALTPEQAEQKIVIFNSSMGKAFGILVGCIIGMFPLLFINSEKEDEQKDDKS